MSDRCRVKLGTLLDIAFDIPQSGVLNIHLLFEILRALIGRLGLKDFEVLVDPGAPGSTSSHALLDKSFPDGQENGGGTGGADGTSPLLSPSLMAMDPEARAAEIARRRAEEVGQVLNLLKAYLVRLQALEAGQADLRAKRAEDLETMGKMLNQMDLLDARLCEQEKTVAKLTAELECLGLAMLDYDIKFEDVYRQLDLAGVEIREVKCQIRCIEKEREQFVTAVRTVTEQINHFSVTKADKEEMERELGLRAMAEDLKQYVPCECFSQVQLEVGRNVAKLYEEIYQMEQKLKAGVYELNKALQMKAELVEQENLRRHQAKILSKLRQLDDQCHAKGRSTSAGIVLKEKGSANCLTCGVEASLEGNCPLIPRPVQFVPPSKAKEIFTLRSRYCGGNFTVTKPDEKVLLEGPVLGLQCIGKAATGANTNQIIGGDGCIYLADPCLEHNKQINSKS